MPAPVSTVPDPRIAASLGAFVRTLARAAVANPRFLARLARIALRQPGAARRRARQARSGIHVPPVLVVSVTRRCNLRCAGCFARELRTDGPGELSADRLRALVGEARGLGVSWVVLLGGEPLVRADLLPLMAAFPDLLFLVFTNGLLVDDAAADGLGRMPNVVPLLSVEGCEDRTDGRRGVGVHGRVRGAMDRLRARRVPFGLSITVTRSNAREIADESFVREAVGLGARMFLYTEYTPVAPGTEDLVPRDDDRAALVAAVAALRARVRAAFVCLPADEAPVGGCLAAGRGFVHVGPDGAVEPCPFAPWSDASIADRPLAEALKSPFLARLRARPETAHETSGGCSLWRDRDEVAAMLAEARPAE